VSMRTMNTIEGLEIADLLAFDAIYSPQERQQGRRRSGRAATHCEPTPSRDASEFLAINYLSGLATAWNPRRSVVRSRTPYRPW